jgi:hypothetical protein
MAPTPEPSSVDQRSYVESGAISRMSGVSAAGFLRITADWPKYAICVAAHIAYIGAIRRSPAGSRDPAQGEPGKPAPGRIGDDGDTPVPVA